MVKLSKSELVKRLSQKSFKECDLDHNGTIDVKELHVGLLLVYDKLNKSLPVHLTPPSHDIVRVLMKKYDADGNGQLDFQEFHTCVRSMVGLNEKAKFTDSIPFIIASRMLLKMAVLPLAALALREVLKGVAGDSAEKVPGAVLTLGAEGLIKLGKVTLQR